MNKWILILLPFLAIFTISCNSPLKKKNFVDEKKNKLKPDELEDYVVSKLPSELNEISGITFINDSVFAAIEDETGIFYLYKF